MLDKHALLQGTSVSAALAAGLAVSGKVLFGQVRSELLRVASLLDGHPHSMATLVGT